MQGNHVKVLPWGIMKTERSIDVRTQAPKGMRWKERSAFMA